MKGERVGFFGLFFFFLLLAWVIASLRHFPLMLAPCYTRCCRHLPCFPTAGICIPRAFWDQLCMGSA